MALLRSCWTRFNKVEIPSWCGGKESACQCRKCKSCRFNFWVWKILWRRKWQPTPVFLPGEIPWTEEPGRLQLMGFQRVGHDRACMCAKYHKLGTLKQQDFFLLPSAGRKCEINEQGYASSEICRGGGFPDSSSSWCCQQSLGILGFRCITPGSASVISRPSLLMCVCVCVCVCVCMITRSFLPESPSALLMRTPIMLH